MEYLRFIFFLGVIYITFDGIWRLFLFLLKLTLGIDRQENIPHHIFKSFGYYLLVSLTAALTIQNVATSTTFLAAFGYNLIAFVVLYFYITSSMQKSRMKAAVNMDTVAMKRMRYNSIYILASLLFFVLCVNFPQLVETEVTQWLFTFIQQIYDLILFRILIGFLAFLFLLNMLYKGLLTTRMLFMGLFGIKPKSTSSYKDMFGRSNNAHEQETIDIEYKEVEDK